MSNLLTDNAYVSPKAIGPSITSSICIFIPMEMDFITLSGSPGTPKYFEAKVSENVVSKPVVDISPPNTTGISLSLTIFYL